MQKMVEFTGPFSVGQTITIEPVINTTYTHIGIQIPYREPISIQEEQQDEASITPTTFVANSWRQIKPEAPDVSVNGKTLRINPSGILEHDELGYTNIRIQILRSLPPESIIDVVVYTREIE